MPHYSLCRPRAAGLPLAAKLKPILLLILKADQKAQQWGEAENTWLSCISSNLMDGEHPFYQAQVYFDQCLREETNNKYGLDIYVGGQLGSDSEMVEGCLNGTYEFCP